MPPLFLGGRNWEVPEAQLIRQRKSEVYVKIAGMLLLVVGVSGVAMGAVAPEIDPSSGVSALALLSGALLVFRGSRKR